MAEYALNALDECARCGKRSDMTVDHLTVAFSVLANRFAASLGGSSVGAGASELENDATGRGWYVRDAGVAARWREFHRANADYQMLCRSCNSRKGPRAAEGQQAAAASTDRHGPRPGQAVSAQRTISGRVGCYGPTEPSPSDSLKPKWPVTPAGQSVRPSRGVGGQLASFTRPGGAAWAVGQ